jgi:hypothetical protein
MTDPVDNQAPTKPTSVTDVLSSASGISTVNIKEIWARVQENQARLRSCPGPAHLFRSTGNRTVAPDFQCDLCGGKISSNDKCWYEMGREHGRKETESDKASSVSTESE